MALVIALGGAIAPSHAVAQEHELAEAGLPLEGSTTRTVLGGRWLLRLDRGDRGIAERWQRRASTAGWKRVAIPNAWNARLRTEAALIGWPAWYRKDFRVPARASRWRIGFEAVNHRATVWLNGRHIGSHAGGFERFEMPLRGLRRRGLNRLVVRVDNRRSPSDFPPFRRTASGGPRDAWWNYGGIIRAVYIRPIDTIDFADVRVAPEAECPGCSATVRFQLSVRNFSRRRQRVSVDGSFGESRFTLPALTIDKRRRRVVTGELSLPGARLWSPHDPFLYDVTVNAALHPAGRPTRRAARYRLQSGIRSVSVSGDGRLQLNGRPVNLRGVGLHEDLPGKGAALTAHDYRDTIARIEDLGATLVRSHYPLHPLFQQLADQHGVLVWSEVPVLGMDPRVLGRRAVRRRALGRLIADIRTNWNHPSVVLWSVGNELDGTVPPAVRDYFAEAAATARRLDPSRPVGVAIAGHPRVACRPGYESLDVIGINDYFGWYGRDIANRDALAPYLDRMRACHRTQALLISEFGAEANRHGSADEKGTFEFQTDFIRYHLGVFATKPWLSGASYWTLREFAIRPSWKGGNPRPEPPMHQKGVIHYDGRLKPAYAELQRHYRGTTPQTP